MRAHRESACAASTRSHATSTPTIPSSGRLPACFARCQPPLMFNVEQPLSGACSVVERATLDERLAQALWKS